MSLAQEIAQAEAVEDGHWEARIVCTPEAAKALRTATAVADPYLTASVTDQGLRLTAKRQPNWAGVLLKIQNAALDPILLGQA